MVNKSQYRGKIYKNNPITYFNTSNHKWVSISWIITTSDESKSFNTLLLDNGFTFVTTLNELKISV